MGDHLWTQLLNWSQQLPLVSYGTTKHLICDKSEELMNLFKLERCLFSLTRDAGNAEYVGIADSKLIHHCARLVGINDHDFTCREGTRENPDSAGCGIHLVQLLYLQEIKMKGENQHS